MQIRLLSFLGEAEREKGLTPKYNSVSIWLEANAAPSCAKGAYASEFSCYWIIQLDLFGQLKVSSPLKVRFVKMDGCPTPWDLHQPILFRIPRLGLATGSTNIFVNIIILIFRNKVAKKKRIRTLKSILVSVWLAPTPRAIMLNPSPEISFTLPCFNHFQFYCYPFAADELILAHLYIQFGKWLIDSNCICQCKGSSCSNFVVLKLN